jgi:hypothetical protein
MSGTHDDELSRLRDELTHLREENEELRQVAPARPAAPSGGHRRSRALVSWALLVIASLLVPVALVGVWARTQVLDTDRYVETVAPLADDPAVQDRVVEVVTESLTSQVDLESEIRQALPERAAFLAGPIAGSVRQLVGNVVGDVVRSDRFADIWAKANRAAHGQVVKVLAGEGDGPAAAIVLDLQGVAGAASAKLADLGVPVRPEGNVPFTLFSGETLDQIRSVARVADAGVTFVAVLAVLLLVASALVAVDRRRGALRAGIGLAAGAALVLVAIAVARGFYLPGVEAGTARAANEAAIDLLSRFLRGGGRTLVAVGVVVAVGAWLAGPGRVASALRSGVGRAGDETGARVDLGPVGRFVAAHLMALRLAAVGAAAVWLVLADRPAAGTVLWVAVAVAVVLVVLGVVARAARTARSSVDEPVSERVVDAGPAGTDGSPTAGAGV